MELRIRYSPEQIIAAVRKLAAEIAADYGERPLLFVVVLKGALFFAADLAREVRLPLTVDFVRLSSYQGTESTGMISMPMEMEHMVTDRDVLVIEDIVDTGQSLAYLLKALQAKKPRSIRVCALIDKRGTRKADVAPDYAGFVCKGGFLVGYGLDLDEQFRHLPAIYEVIG